MKFLPAIILSLTLVTRAKSESTELCFPSCDSHEDIVSRMLGIYEEENCSISESNGNFNMNCGYDVPGWRNSYAEYHAKSCSTATAEENYNPKSYSISYGSNGASSMAWSDLVEECFDSNEILRFVLPYMDKPDEAPIPSEAPYSEAPYSEVPNSQAPYNSGCGNPSDHHDDVLGTLFNTFGRANCQKTTSTMDCEAKAFGYRASANYQWELREGLNYPAGLTVTSTYTKPGGSSYMEWIEFEEACVEDTHLSSIQWKLNLRSCPNASGSFAFRGDQEFTCLELAGLRFRKLQRVCASEIYSDFGENCRGVCRTGEYCQCVDNPVAFPVGRDKTMTCQRVAELNDAKKAKKCSRTKIQQNCPSVCGIGDCAWA